MDEKNRTAGWVVNHSTALLIGSHRFLIGGGLAALCVILYVWGLGDAPFYSKGEPREATVVWEIYTSGEWILPLRNGHIIPSKPPLFHWLGALFSLAGGGLSELTIRLPSALLATTGVLLTYAVGTALWGTEVGLVAGIILATNFEWVRAAVSARVDMTLTTCMVAAFLFFFVLHQRHQVWRWQALLFFALLGLATLAKGPVGMILPALTVGIFLMLHGELGFLRKLHLVQGGLVFLLIAGSWYELALWQGGYDFFAKQVLKENLLRFFTPDTAGAGHAHGFSYLVSTFFLGMVPWSFFLPPVIVFLYQSRSQWREKRLLYFIVWSLTVFGFYALSSSKRPVYLLPLYPAVALLLAVWWKELQTGTVVLARPFSWLVYTSGYLSVVFVSAVILLVLAQLLGYDFLALVRSLLTVKQQRELPFFAAIVAGHRLAFWLWVAAATVSTVFLAASLKQQRWSQVFTTLALFTCSTFLLMNQTLRQDTAKGRSFQSFMARITTQIGPLPLYFYQTFDSGGLFYANRRIPFYEGFSSPPPGPCYLLLWEEKWPALAAKAISGVRVIETSEGTGPKGKQHLVLVFVPADATIMSADPPPATDEADEEDAL